MRFLHPLIAPGRRVRAGALVLAMGVVGPVGLSPVAQAAGPATPRAAVASVARGDHAFAVRPATTPSQITVSSGGNSCTISVDSTYIGPGGYVDGDGSVSCTYTVYKIVLEVALFYGTTEENYTTNTGYSTRFITDTTSATHLSGTWQTGAAADIYWTSASSYTLAGPVYSVPDTL